MEDKKISVVILTRNEERNIRACLEGCSFADEIIVVDDGSTDKTVEIARSFGERVRIFTMPWMEIGRSSKTSALIKRPTIGFFY